jgi:signal transduction histidine kinase
MARAEKLFQPFQRLHQPHEFGGLGIGLATAQRIVQRHGGTMQAQAQPGLGATFCFTLPGDEASDSLPSHPPA